ncbi:DNA-directed RNA polymerase, mitochondrial isoform X2 [Colias croceus]|uniref:DNA-directed RNA polymerase, mitochondrial isoform X1 n=1 Tax=Colias crocea TaxID=72248 RepID=UPI001E27F7FD|nr:DNA-directed RNA polymerase, mitochondrial isoform X1 [Colias croceus]XP_045500470.1 DNA-directed RNA polymerase, mitochondrial isoform X2 [Colias croceus]
MHRIISARNLYHSNFHGLNSQSNVVLKNASVTEVKCSFCRKILQTSYLTENLFSTRHQSTKTASLLRSQKKKVKHKGYKKYGELLEVNHGSMMESKVSISKLHASHLSKLASSPVSLGQLHQLTKPIKKVNNIEIDPELLESVKKKILKKNSSEVKLEDDKCALIFTSHQISSVENRFKTKQYIDMVKQSYYDFRKATLYDQRLKDLRYAINEGLTQELNLDMPFSASEKNPMPKSPHAVFREFFIDNSNLDDYDQELMTHLSSLQIQGLSQPVLEDICDDPSLNSDINENKDDHIELDNKLKYNLKKAKKAVKAKRKKMREKRRAAQEVNMKEDKQEMERRGKEEALQRTLAAHIQLLCSLNMVAEGDRVLKYYRQRNLKNNAHPSVKNVKIYNTMLHGYASVGQLENAKELLSYMFSDGINVNAQTFAAIFECVERSQMVDKITVLNYYRKLMEEKGIQLNDLLDKSKFLFDQRETVLNAIRRIEPYFEPMYTPPELDYNCPLMEKLKINNVDNRKGLHNSPVNGLLSFDQLKAKGMEQIKMEMDGEIEVQNISIKDDEPTTVRVYRELLSEAENEWRGVIKEAFIRNLSTLKSRSNASHSAITLYPYLKVLEVDEFVEIVMNEITKLVDGSETYSPTLKLLQRDLGVQVYNKYQIEQFKKNGVLQKIENVYEKYCKWYLERHPLDDTGRPYNSRQAWQLLVHQNREGASLDIEETPWSTEIRQNIGKFLYNIIINDVKIDVNLFKPKSKVKKLPAVYKVHRPWGRLVRLELKPHPVLSRLCAAAARPALRLRAALAPTVSPPAPWLAPTAPAAYLLTATPLVRMPVYVMSQMKRLEEAPQADLYPVLDSLNQLGEVPWVINQSILDLQLKVFKSGGDKKLDIPPPASSLQLSDIPGENEGSSAYKRRLAYSRARADMHSLWCDSLYKLSLANHYRERMFWLPHNMDFRGRVYAVGPHVSALGADAARALLRLARTRPLGPKGLMWLKLHAINLTGTKKRNTVEERLEYADSIMDKILDSADRPLDGMGWWKESEEPWQTLACCIEIANAVRSPNHEEYECGFPVHQDGSCNGLQHYAALGGDAVGAAAVNLAPLPRPQDVYSEVAALVETMRVRDAEAGVKQAIILENFVRRKVIKQTVMTTVYGVTKFGARLQIAKQLKDIEDFPKEHVWTCSQYLTTKTFDSLREMFTSTKLIQDWFTDCAKLISGVCGESVQWVTPLGLPVLQPYFRRAAPSHAAPLDLMQRPCTMKQRNAFPPNFIHSLDSSHMMLTGLHCEAEGITFVSVHDCFWTHPDTVDKMNEICREQFVALHSQPILENLSDYMVKTYSYAEEELEDGSVGASNKKRVNSLLRKVPEKGDFDIRSVLKSVYFFS